MVVALEPQPYSAPHTQCIGGSEDQFLLLADQRQLGGLISLPALTRIPAVGEGVETSKALRCGSPRVGQVRDQRTFLVIGGEGLDKRAHRRRREPRFHVSCRIDFAADEGYRFELAAHR